MVRGSWNSLFDARPTFESENGCRKKKKKKPNMKLRLLFTEVLVVMIMAYRAEKEKNAEVLNENKLIKTNTIGWK